MRQTFVSEGRRKWSLLILVLEICELIYDDGADCCSDSNRSFERPCNSPILGAGNLMREGLLDQTQAMLRYAQKLAIAQRRDVWGSD